MGKIFKILHLNLYRRNMYSMLRKGNKSIDYIVYKNSSVTE